MERWKEEFLEMEIKELRPDVEQPGGAAERLWGAAVMSQRPLDVE